MSLKTEARRCECHGEPMLRNGSKAWQCAVRKRKRDQRWYGQTDPIQRKSRMLRTYGLTVEEYDEILETQGGVCAICQNECATGRRLAVDHDHETGIVRGLLCHTCNLGLGALKDDLSLLEAAAKYLIRHIVED